MTKLNGTSKINRTTQLNENIRYRLTEEEDQVLYVLIDENSNPTECTKVYLSDGSFVYAVVKYDTFKKNYQEFLDTIAISSQSSNEPNNP